VGISVPWTFWVFGDLSGRNGGLLHLFFIAFCSRLLDDHELHWKSSCLSVGCKTGTKYM
jgi:hypothetical protein